LTTWDEQEMSNTVWAMATLSHPKLQLCEAIADEAVRRRLDTFAPQAISNLVWGFANLEFNHGPFMSVRCVQLVPHELGSSHGITAV
jgi:hypothetical protein